MGRNQEIESQKENILIPYTLEVVEILREVERYVRGQYMERKNSVDLKSLDPQQEIEIIIKIPKIDYENEDKNQKGEEKNCFWKLLGRIRKQCDIKEIDKNGKDEQELDTMIVILILARILGYDGEYLWNEIHEFIDKNKKKPIEQPFYKFKYYGFHKTESKTGLVVKDYIAIPKDFVAAYFGYDTGIDGLNQLIYGGFLLPPDRSAYISVSGEAGIGKTALVVRLITAFFQNYNFKNVHYPYKEGEIKTINKDDVQPLSIHYILMEQHEKNIIRLIKECQLIDENNKNVQQFLKNGGKITEKVIGDIIHFEKSDMFSPMGLIEKVESIENPRNEQNKKQRKVIIIDSVNAIQEMDIKRTEWRELFQSIKAITRNGNTIVFFVVEKKSEEPDFVIEYLSDVVIKLYRNYKEEAFYRVFELVESRFQRTISGKHNFYITKPDSGFIRVYPSTTAMGELLPHRKRVKPTEPDDRGNRKEVGIKIDGIINFFKYSHLLQTKMEPFFPKNSISMFIGDRGAHKSAFAKKFALSAFRDERWETCTNYIVEIDYREQEPNKPLEELLTIGFWNARPVEKSISLLLYFSENYDENPEKDIIWETYFGKVIIPGCKGPDKNYIGHISHIVCLYEVKDYTEDVYIYQLEELIRTIESCEAKDEVPGSYYDFINRKSISLIHRITQKDGTQGPKNFNSFNIIYEGNFIKNFKIYRELIDRFIKREIHIMNFKKNDIKATKIKELLKDLVKQKEVIKISEQAALLEKNPFIEYYDPIIDTIAPIIDAIKEKSWWWNKLSSIELDLLKSRLEKIYRESKTLSQKMKGTKNDELLKTREFISKFNQKKKNLSKLILHKLFGEIAIAALKKLKKEKELNKLQELLHHELYKQELEENIKDLDDRISNGKEELKKRKIESKLQSLFYSTLKKIEQEKNEKKLRESLRSAFKKLDFTKNKKYLENLLDSLLNELNLVVLEVSKGLNRAINELLEKFKDVKKTFCNRTGVPKINNLIEEGIHRIDFIRRMLIFQASDFNEDNKTVEFLKAFYDENEEYLFNMELLDPDKIRVNGKKKLNENAFDYNGINKVKVSRIVLDDAENLDKVYKSLDPPKYISTLAHLCLAKEITLGIVNTRSKDETSEVDTVCNAVSDNAFQFEKFFFKGEMFTTFSIIRSATSFHNNMMYYLSEGDDGLLQLKNTFALLSDVDKRKPELIEIHLFLPDLSKEFSKSMYRILLNRDRILNRMLKSDGSNDNKEENKKKEEEENNKDGLKDFARRIDYASEFKVINQQKELETIYNPRERFPSIYKDWHDFLKDMITYSLAHPEVEVFTANDPFTDISIILDDESAKNAISILCLPGYLMDLYEKNLASISDYVHFCGNEDYQPVWTHLKDKKKWIEIMENNEEDEQNPKNDNKKVKLGNEFYYLQKAPIRVPDGPRKSEEDDKNKNKNENSWKHFWIVPEILFNPAIARDETTNQVIIKEYKNQKYMDIKGYPYYIDPRVNLVFSTEDSKDSEESIPDYFVHNDAHDFVALFFELWFNKADGMKNCEKKHKDRPCKAGCNFCFFEQATKEKNKNQIREIVEEFVKHVKKSVLFNQQGLAKNIVRWFNNNDSGEKEIVLREWYSSAQQKLKVIEPLLMNLKRKVHVRLEIPKYFLYTTWYLAIPLNSPRKDMASEIIIKMTEFHDLAHHQISGIGLQLDERFYDKNMDKFYPQYDYSKVLRAMKNLNDYNKKCSNEKESIGIPIASNHCYFENLTLLGGFLGDFYRYYKNSVSTDKNFPRKIDDPGIEEITKEDNDNIDKLTEKLIKFSKNFKNWQREDTKRCNSCYMTYLLCQYKEKKDECKRVTREKKGEGGK